MKTNKITIPHSYDLTSFLKEGEVVAFNVGYSEELLVLVARNNIDYQEVSNSGAIFPKTKPKQAQCYEIFIGIDGELISICKIKNESYNIHDIQALPQDKFLLICSRSYYKDNNNSEKNGRVYSSTGELLSEILLGDGIQSAQSNSNGEIWTSYFDEGVFGNYGWNNPIGSSGLLSWDIHGNILYEYQPTPQLEWIADCYALNVISNTETWCYYYTDFPLVRIKNKKIVDFWNIPISGSNAFAVQDRYTLFCGGYNDSEILNLIELSIDHKCKSVAKYELFTQEEENFKSSWMFGRKDKIYILKNNKIYIFSIIDAFAEKQS